MDEKNENIEVNNWMDIWKNKINQSDLKRDDLSKKNLLELNGHTKYTDLEWNKLINNIKKNINYDKNKIYNILDVGCGTGVTLMYFKNNNLYGLDQSKNHIELAKKYNKNCSFLLGDALDVEKYMDNFFDIILCHSVTQYFNDKKYFNKFIKLCQSKLKYNGVLSITDILLKEKHKYFIQDKINKMGKNKYNEFYTKKNLNHSSFTKNEIKEMTNNLFKNVKFQNETEFTFNLFCFKNNVTIRENNLLTNENTMQYLYKLKDFPVSLSCVSSESKHNKKMDMIFEICKKTGIIQIKNAPALEDIYISPHNSSYGKVWHDLFDLFSNILFKYIKNNINILEIGGGALLLASKILTNNKIKKYTVYEKNLTLRHSDDKRINIIDEYFTNNTLINDTYEFYIHSHVLEHVWNPREFIESIGNNIKTNSYHCFIVPYLKETFSKKYTNALDFEHNFFIIEEYIDVILNNNNFKIIEKKYYLDHSIIYVTQKIENNNLILKSFPNLYEQNKKIALDFYNYHKNLIKTLNEKIDNFDGNLYLFGGTGFSIYLIIFGLNTEKVLFILDNDPEKENKKVYGTNFIVKNPKIIKDKENVAVIVKAASYQDEIEEQLYELNNNVLIFK